MSRNVYMGRNSTANIPTKGPVDTDIEVLLTMQATAYDALNGRMLTRRPGVFDPASKREINGRFSVLKLLCKKYAPEKTRAVEELHRVVIANMEGRISDLTAVQKIKGICMRHGLDSHLADDVMMRIDAAEMMQKRARKQNIMMMKTGPKQQVVNPFMKIIKQQKQNNMNPSLFMRKMASDTKKKQLQNNDALRMIAHMNKTPKIMLFPVPKKMVMARRQPPKKGRALNPFMEIDKIVNTGRKKTRRRGLF